ncbi:hypothetical protein MesoLj131c_71840 (plasmid) [Mesorhizobium sp. 131-3-5]|nr:hypothetical protein MesoLj131c_71840 [Mesorhizobium sp. 131-3-5]
MVDTAEDNFRIEVWDREEKTHLETICRTPDAVVSQAAWHAAIRRRPGMLLTDRSRPGLRRVFLVSSLAEVEQVLKHLQLPREIAR